MNMPEPPSGPWSDPQQWSSSESAAVEQPDTIRLAVRLMWVGAALSLLGLVLTFAQSGDLREQLDEAAQDSGDRLTEEELDTAVRITLTVFGIVGVAAIALWIWMATANGQGRSWARTTATVLGVLNVAFTLLGFVGGQFTALSLIVSIVNIGLAVTILVLLYRPESSRYYDQRSALTA